MEGTAHRWASPGELVAYALPPGFHWLEILAAHAQSGRLVPADRRAAEPEGAASVAGLGAPLGRGAPRRGNRPRRCGTDRSRARLGGGGDERHVRGASPGAAAACRGRLGRRRIARCARRLGLRSVGVVPDAGAHRRTARPAARRAHRLPDHRPGAVRARRAAGARACRRARLAGAHHARTARARGARPVGARRDRRRRGRAGPGAARCRGAPRGSHRVDLRLHGDLRRRGLRRGAVRRHARADRCGQARCRSAGSRSRARP